MLTDRELDARLAAASGVQDADLPALPEEFLAILLAEAGTEQDTAEAEPASVIAARQLVTDAHEARAGSRVRRRRPSRKAVVRVGAGMLVIAAAWATAVVVRTPGQDQPPSTAPAITAGPKPPLDPPGGLDLVAAEAIAFPYSLDPAPTGLTPVLGRFGGLTPFGTEPPGWRADYRSATDPGFTFTVTATDPRIPQPGTQEAGLGTVVASGTTSVHGTPADFDSGTQDSPLCQYVPSTPTQAKEPKRVCSDTFAELFWHRPDGRWVHAWGEGVAWSKVPALVSVAEAIVDRPQAVPLQVGLAPAGWSVSSYEDGRGLTLVDDTAPSFTNQISVTLQERWRRITKPDDVLRGMADGNPVERVTVQGLPAELVSVPDHVADPGSGRRTWYLAGQLPGGPVFLLQAPDTLSRDDVLAMADQVTYSP